MRRRLSRSQQAAFKAAVGCMLVALGSVDAQQPPTLSSVTVSATVVTEDEVGVIQAEEVLPNTTTEITLGTEMPFKMSPHVTCLLAYLVQQREAGDYSDLSNANAPLTVPIPIAYANPIDITNKSSQEYQFGGVNGTRDNMVIFPNIADGMGAAISSIETYAGLNYNIAGLINVWAPSATNPYAQANMAADLGITTTQLANIRLIDLTTAGQYDVIAAFAWQEGLKPNGC